MPRPLTVAEERVLEVIQDQFGQQNTAETVTWVHDGAFLFVTDVAGTIVLGAHLTNLAAWRLDGTIASEAELKRDWLGISEP